jgi:hypothetical protein
MNTEFWLWVLWSIGLLGSLGFAALIVVAAISVGKIIWAWGNNIIEGMKR